MNKFMNKVLFPAIVFFAVIYTAYFAVKFAINRIATDPANASYITMKEREKDLLCLTDNIYGESAGENAESKISVAQVTLNRLESGKFGKDLCSVVYSKSQFSWTISMPKSLRVRDTKAYNESKEVAKKVLLEGFRLPSIKTALWYHADYIQKPYWANNKKELAKIGHHYFYS